MSSQNFYRGPVNPVLNGQKCDTSIIFPTRLERFRPQICIYTPKVYISRIARRIEPFDLHVNYCIFSA